MEVEEKKPFLEHLEELRQRLIVCILAVGIGFVVSYFFSDKLFLVLIRPLREALPKESHLIFTSLPEMFVTYLKVSLVTGIMLASPVIFYELWKFVAPGLYQNEKRLLVPFVLSSCVLFLGGAVFGYFVVFPFGFRFFLGFSNEYIKALPSVKQYFSFSMKLLIAFGIVFELPVITYFLTKIGLVTPQFLKNNRKYAVVIIFALAAIFTPPDVMTQFMMAVPLIVLYEVSIMISKIAYAGKRKEE
jgi:sec-independent protein translocase protein TatC